MGSKPNSELVNELVDDHSVNTQKVERVLRLVDRGIFVHPHRSSLAYGDGPFRSINLHPGQIHISAPSIYATVIEMLDLHKGQSFLNIGSGSGYLSAMVGFLIGADGTSHGVELHSNIIEHAHSALDIFTSQKFIAAYDWCCPQFVHGNAFLLRGISRKYDRIYIGAQVEEGLLGNFKEMLKEDGIMIVPVTSDRGGFDRTRFQRVKRVYNGFEHIDFMSVTFANLVQPNEDEERPESSSTSRKRKIKEQQNNPNDCVSFDLLALFKPKTLASIACQEIRKRIGDLLRMSHPVAIVQTVRDGRTHDSVLETAIRRHNAREEERELMFAQRARILEEREQRHQREGRDMAEAHEARLRVQNERLARIMQRMDDDEIQIIGIRRLNNPPPPMGPQEIEARMEAAFNEEARNQGEHQVDEEGEFVLGEQLANIVRREVEAHEAWEVLRREAEEEAALSTSDSEEEAEIRRLVDPPVARREAVPEQDIPEELRVELEAEVVRFDDVVAQNPPVPPPEFRELELVHLLGEHVFNPFRMRRRNRRNLEDSSDDDEESIGRRERRWNTHHRNNICRDGRCRENPCVCRVLSLRDVARRVMDLYRWNRLNRRAKAKPWVQRITILVGKFKPKSFADQLPKIFEEEEPVPMPSGRLSIEDWYLQREKEKFIAKLAELQEAVRVTGRAQFKQEENEFLETDNDALSDSSHTALVTYKNEEDSIARLEKKLVEVVETLPLSEIAKKSLKWYLYRDQ